MLTRCSFFGDTSAGAKESGNLYECWVRQSQLGKPTTVKRTSWPRNAFSLQKGRRKKQEKEKFSLPTMRFHCMSMNFITESGAQKSISKPNTYMQKHPTIAHCSIMSNTHGACAMQPPLYRRKWGVATPSRCKGGCTGGFVNKNKGEQLLQGGLQRGGSDPP